MTTNQMWPLNSASKTKRIRWGCTMTPLTWAWYKELRERNKTRKVYDVNPYVEVYQFRENIYAIFADNLDGQGDEWMYLINGPEKAMLIDTSYGLGDIKGLCHAIVGNKELIVVNTHDHFDHAYGNCRFEKVYCHEHLVPYLESQHEHMWDYIFDALGQNLWVDFPREELPVFKKYEIVGVPDGYTWDLGGGYEIELIFTGGHCAGHAMYLDKTARVLFTGDNLCTVTSSCGYLGNYRNTPYSDDMLMTVCRDRFQYLVDRLDEYDYIFPQHHMTNLESSVIPNVLDALNEILEDPEHNYDYLMTSYDKDRTVKKEFRCKFVKGFSAIRYN